jgi:hypothetical protein
VHTMTFRRAPVRNHVAVTLLGLLGGLALAGCGSQPQVTGTTGASAGQRQPFTRILVVGVSPDVNQRCGFEFFMASQLKSETLQAIRSCDAVKQKVPLTLDSIEQAVATYQADAVLATNLVSRSFKSKEGGDVDTRGAANYKAVGSGWATGYYGVYGVPVVYGEFETAPPVTVAEGEVRVESKLYATRDRALVYTLDTKAGNLESTDVALHDVAAAIADKLRRQGLVR